MYTSNLHNQYTNDYDYRRLPRVGGYNRVQLLIPMEPGQHYLFEWMFEHTGYSNLEDHDR